MAISARYVSTGLANGPSHCGSRHPIQGPYTHWPKIAKMQPIHSTDDPIQIFKSPCCSRSCHFARVALARASSLGGTPTCASSVPDLLELPGGSAT
jgi:hypothetical protein